MHVASLTSATTLSTQCSSTTDKGCSVLRIACGMPVSLVIYYKNYIEIIVYKFLLLLLSFFKKTSCRNCSWYLNKAGNTLLLHWVLEHAGKTNKPPRFSHSVGSPSSKMTALDSTAAMNMWSCGF